MSKTYQIKVNQGTGESKFIDIPAEAGKGKPMHVKAVAGGKYQLLDVSSGFAPENIRASRSGKDLHVFFEGREEADLVIVDYYEVTAEGFNGLIGEAESGSFYEYIPESALGQTAVPLLSDKSSPIGMALGGVEINPSGAAVGVLVAAAGLFNPLLLGAGALGAAAIASGGGGSDAGNGTGTGTETGTGPDTTPPTIKSAQLHVDDDSGPKDNVTNDKTPRIVVETEANADVEVVVNGKTYTGKADANGQAVIQIPDTDPLPDGPYTPKVTATDAAKNKSAVFDGTPFTIDTSASENSPNLDPNTAATLSIQSISEDTGISPSDFHTKDNTLDFKGSFGNFTPNGDWIKLDLKDSQGIVIDTHYLQPTPGADSTKPVSGEWVWERKAELADGKYTLVASVVDGAGNLVAPVNGSPITAEQVLFVDTKANSNINEGGSAVNDANHRAGILTIDSMDRDTGVSSSDFITQDRTHIYKGEVKGYVNNGGALELKLFDDKDAVISKAFIQPDKDGKWTWDLSGIVRPDGIYKLEAAVVDKAGNHVINAVSQQIVVDNKGRSDTADSNAGFVISNMAMVNDTGPGPENKLNEDFVTSDGGNLNDTGRNVDGVLVFTGKVSPPNGQNYADNGGKVAIQIIDAAGALVRSDFVVPNSENIWEFTSNSPFDDGQYTLKASLMDAAGNLISVKDQSFVIDTKVLRGDDDSSGDANGPRTIKEFRVGSDVKKSETETGTEFQEEYATFKLGDQDEIGEYFGGNLDLGFKEKTIFEAGKFQLTLWDQAGNKTEVMNSVEWTFDTANAVSLTADSPGAILKKDLTGGQALGSVGRLAVENDFDMALLYDGIDTVPDQAAANHVVLSNSKDVNLDISLGDILNLGITNSFSVADAHKGTIQMRVDGDAGDTLDLDGLLGGPGSVSVDWSKAENSLEIAGDAFDVYSNAIYGVTLFVDTDVKVTLHTF